MHKICYGIVAFEKPEHIKRKIEALYTEEDFFIVHWNKNSSKQEFLELTEMFNDYSNVYIHSKHRVYWGDISILNASLSNIKKSLQLNLEFDHFICLSQQTYPIKSIDYIKTCLSNYKDKSFIYSMLIELNNTSHPFRSKGTISDPIRLVRKCYPIYFHKNNRFTLLGRIKEFYMLFINFIYYFPKILPKTISILKKVKHLHPPQEMLNSNSLMQIQLSLIKYIIRVPYWFVTNALYNDWREGFHNYTTDLLSPVYRNNTYALTKNSGPDLCLTKKHIEYILTDKKSKKFLKNITYTFAPEEFYMETVLYYSPFYQTECLTDFNCMSTFYCFPALLSDMHRQLINPNQFSQLKTMYPDIVYTFDNTLFTRKIEDEAVMDLLDEYITRS